MGLADYIKNKLPYWPNWITYPLLKMNFLKGWSYGKAYMNYGKTIEDVSPEQKLIETVNYAIGHVPYYKNLYGNLRIGSIQEFEEKIGYINKDIVMDNWEQFISDEIDWNKCNTGTTGGTSGKPLKLVTPKNRYIHSMYFWHRQLKQFGWNYNTVAVLRNHKLEDSRDYIINPLMRQIIFDAFRTSDDYFKKVWLTIKRYNIKFIHAYPSAVYAFLKSCHRQSLDTSFLRACFLTSEAITENQRYFIMDVLGIPILGSYGHSEKLCQAGTCLGDFRYHIDEQYGYTEIIKNSGVVKEPNVIGEITGTTFTNRYFMLIRYKTGDYASYSEFSPERILNSIEGRWDKSIIYRFDNTTTSVTALNLHGDFYERINGIQYIQNKKGYLTINILKDHGYSDEDHRFITDFMSDAMGGKEYVTINYVDKLIFQSNGKFLPLISNIQSY